MNSYLPKLELMSSSCGEGRNLSISALFPTPRSPNKYMKYSSVSSVLAEQTELALSNDPMDERLLLHMKQRDLLCTSNKQIPECIPLFNFFSF